MPVEVGLPPLPIESQIEEVRGWQCPYAGRWPRWAGHEAAGVFPKRHVWMRRTAQHERTLRTFSSERMNLAGSTRSSAATFALTRRHHVGIAGKNPRRVSNFRNAKPTLNSAVA
jgi:hypothetical protein